MRMKRLLLAAAALGAAASVCAAQTTLLRGVTLIDVEAGQARPGVSVLVEGDRIVRVGPAAETPAPDGAAVVEGAGLFLIPGLFDAHVHYVAGEDVFGPLLVAHGVTAARDTGGPTEQSLALRVRSRADEVMPELFVTGAIIDGVPPVWPFSEACSTPEQARDAVRRLAEAGVDQIKVYSRLERPVYMAAVEEARAQGLTVTGHVPASTALLDAARAGHGCVEHFEGFGPLLLGMLGDEAPRGPFAAFAAWTEIDRVDREALRAALREIAELGVMQCPTLIVNRSIGSIADGAGPADERMKHVPPHMRAFWDGPQYARFAPYAGRAVAPMQTMVGEAHRAGVPLMIGTDLANPYVFAGSSVHDEMALFQEAGVPAADVLRMATIAPARFLGVDDRLGSVAEGKTASMALLRANPLEDIGHVREVEAVFLRGRHYDRAALDAMLGGVERLVAGPGEAADADAIGADLPGREVARGRYRMKFEQWEAGVEDFVITRSDTGHHLFTHTQPVGGGQVPSRLTLHVDGGFKIIGARWEQLAAQGTLTAEYTVDGGAVVAEARRGDGEPQRQRFELPAAHALLAPGYASFMVTAMGAGLDEGEETEGSGLVFGFPDWRVTAAPGFRIARRDDTTIERAGVETPAMRFEVALPSEMGEIRYEWWTDDRGVMLRLVMRLPMGTLSAELE